MSKYQQVEEGFNFQEKKRFKKKEKKVEMKPILLQGHTRPLTKVKYNVHGDLLFSVAKDSQPSVWFSHNGERLGTFNGHSGAIWDLDVSCTILYIINHHVYS